jgi:mutual gliding-motility protein MglA
VALTNQIAKEIHCKIVYYGPSLGGKTTNVQWIYEKTSGQSKSEMMAFNSNPERTLFFDFLPMNGGEIHGQKIRFHLYSVPGQVVYEATRRLVMRNVDAIIFVADSQLERMDENIENMKNLERDLDYQGQNIRQVPLVIQYNKRDLYNIASVAEMRAALNRYNAPDFEAVASIGRGVLEPLKTATKSIITTLKGGEL